MKLTNEQMVALYNLENDELISLIATLSMVLSGRLNPATEEELLMEQSMRDGRH